MISRRTGPRAERTILECRSTTRHRPETFQRTPLMSLLQILFWLLLAALALCAGIAAVMCVVDYALGGSDAEEPRQTLEEAKNERIRQELEGRQSPAERMAERKLEREIQHWRDGK